MRAWMVVLGAASAAALPLTAGADPPSMLVTSRASVGQGGVEASGSSTIAGPAISADGRYVAFASQANNLVSGDTNGAADAFVRDRLTGTTQLVSVGLGGAPAHGSALDDIFPVISADGRYVAFSSRADNLVSGDANGAGDAFVRDRAAGTTQLVSLDQGGQQLPNDSYADAISADGRYVAFETLVLGVSTTLNAQVFVRDRLAGKTRLASPSFFTNDGGDSDSGAASVSADGRYVAFESAADDLVQNDTNGAYDVFVYDMQTAATTLASVGPGGAAANGDSRSPRISADGRYVTFFSFATNLVGSDTNATGDIFVRDLATGRTELVSVGPGGVQGNASSWTSAISGDGRYVAFYSDATNLVAGDTNGASDVFVRDRLKGTTVRASLGQGAVQGNAPSFGPAISADGRFIAFLSDATNLVPGDANGVGDVFVRQLGVPALLERRPVVPGLGRPPRR